MRAVSIDNLVKDMDSFQAIVGASYRAVITLKRSHGDYEENT